MNWPRWLPRRATLLHTAIDEGDGPVVILVHGIASSSITFHVLVPMIGQSHRVIAIDLLGFGDSPIPEHASYTVEEHVRALQRTIRSFHLRAPFVLVGHSLGALISSRYAADYPRQVAKLVLVSPPIYLAPSELGDRRDRAAMGLYLKAYEYLRENKIFTMRAARGLDRLSPIRHVLEVSERNWIPFVKSLEYAVESQTTVSDIARVKVPVEIVYGTLDPFLMPASMQLVGRMRHVTIHRVEANDHVIRRRLAKAVAATIG